MLNNFCKSIHQRRVEQKYSESGLNSHQKNITLSPGFFTRASLILETKKIIEHSRDPQLSPRVGHFEIGLAISEKSGSVGVP